MKLFVIGYFTFLFFKLLELKQLPALFGGVAFMFAGYNVVWLGFINVSTVTFLPLTLCSLAWLFKRYKNNLSDTSKLSLLWPFIGLIVSFVIGLLAGHPETLYYCSLLVGCYLVFRLIAFWRAGDHTLQATKHLVRLLLLIGVAGLFALGIASMQLLPFAEYLANSTVANGLDRHAIAIGSPQLWPLQIFPNGLGDASNVSSLQTFPPNYVYHGVNAAYFGGVTLYLALLGVLFMAKNPKRNFIVFFALLALAFATYEYNLGGLRSAFYVIPFIKSGLSSRSYAVLIFTVIACAVFGVDHLLTAQINPARRLHWIAATTIPGLVIMIAGAVGIFSLLQANLPAAVSKVGGLTPDSLWADFNTLFIHMEGVLIIFGLAIFSVGILWLNQSPTRRQWSVALLVFLVFASTGFILRDYTPTVDERLVYPDPPQMAKFLNYAQNKSTLVIGSSLLVPEVNMAYHVMLTGNYDALGIARYEQLLQRLFNTRSAAYASQKISELGMKLFGIDGVAVNDGTLFNTLAQSPTYKLAVSDDIYAIFDYVNRVPGYHTLTNAVIATTDDQAWSLILQPDFDPAQTVILSADQTDLNTFAGLPDASQPVAPTPVQVISETATDIKLKIADYLQEGYLVMAKTFYPGWRATVNNTSQPVFRANYTFSAVRLHKGDNIVDFYYDPDSFKIGTAISIGSLIGLLILIGVGIYRVRFEHRDHLRYS